MFCFQPDIPALYDEGELKRTQQNAKLGCLHYPELTCSWLKPSEFGFNSAEIKETATFAWGIQRVDSRRQVIPI